ncbi:hypothetical protein DAPPUDRAFT_107817 [Daphnia pulex]|uniref:Uncharacterized protein n=1 Tax=Daphnia pulex TaxID=6669 RepID=E9GYB9_DAPPU|nr:hypothetical protein DAPPUDRAFT_107817 [Daphnia pulex]|eukprot:EFX75589.1 hypothetical protein DAPPUDRAFT_107817 [Daphnia pulex]
MESDEKETVDPHRKLASKMTKKTSPKMSFKGGTSFPLPPTGILEVILIKEVAPMMQNCRLVIWWIFQKIEGILSNKVFVDMENEKFIEETKGALKNAESRFVANQMPVPADEGNDSN